MLENNSRRSKQVGSSNFSNTQSVCPSSSRFQTSGMSQRQRYCGCGGSGRNIFPCSSPLSPLFGTTPLTRTKGSNLLLSPLPPPPPPHPPPSPAPQLSPCLSHL